MTHILIDEYLYHRYKEILSMRLLAENNKWMAAAWAFLASLEEHERICKNSVRQGSKCMS
jgi:hypothetical protein